MSIWLPLYIAHPLRVSNARAVGTGHIGGTLLSLPTLEDVSPCAGASVENLPSGDVAVRMIEAWTIHWSRLSKATGGYAGALCLQVCSSGSRCGRAWPEAAILAFHPVGATRRRGQVRVPLRIWCKFFAASPACPDDKGHRAVFGPGLPGQLNTGRDSLITEMSVF